MSGAPGLAADLVDLVTRPQQEAEEIWPSMSGADYRTRWKALAALLLRDPPAGRSGPVTAKVAAVEGLGRAGVPPGLCYALASQLFGLQMPLRGALAEPVWRSLDDKLLCHALTEEGGGSDPLSMATRALREPDGGYRLTGRKAFVTAAPVADRALVFARTGEGRHPFSLSAFLVDLHGPGVRRSDPFPKLALIEVPMGALDFDDVALTGEQVVGEEGAGLALLGATTTWERALLLSYALGPMQRVLDRSVEWCSSREHFERKMGSSHLVAGRIADMARALHRARQLIYGMARRLDAGESVRQLGTDAALTKVSVAEDYVAFSQNAAALGGARSFVEETGLTVDLVSPTAAGTYAGPNDLLRISVARDLGLPVQN